MWISLETAIYADAREKLVDAQQEAMRRFREPGLPPPRSGIFSRTRHAQWPVDPDLPLLHEEHVAPLAAAMFAGAMAKMDAEPPPSADVGSHELCQYRAEEEARYRRLIGGNPADGIDDMNGAQIALLRDAGLRTDRGSPVSELLRNYLRRAMIQLAAIRLARLDGDFSDRITDSLFDGRSPLEPFASTAKRRKSEVALGAAIDRYQAETLDNVTDNPKTALKHRAALALIAAFFGRETLVCDIERAHCTGFRDILAKLPPNATKVGKGQSLSVIADRNAGKPTLAWATQRHYLKMMERLLAWCLTERLLPDNVAVDIPPCK